MPIFEDKKQGRKNIARLHRLRIFFVYSDSIFDLTLRPKYAIIVLIRKLMQSGALLRDHIFDHRQLRSTRKQRIQDRQRRFAVERKRL